MTIVNSFGFAILSVPLAFFLSGCADLGVKEDETGSVTLTKLSTTAFSSSYHCLTTPTTGMRPGFIYRLDEDGGYTPAQEPLDNVSMTEEEIFPGKTTLETIASGGLTAILLEKPEKWDADAQAAIDVREDSLLEFKEPVWERKIFVDSERQMIQAFIKKQGPSESSQYRYIKDTISAHGVNLNLNAEDNLSLSGNLVFSTYFDLSTENTYKDGSRYTLDKDFGQEVQVCVRVGFIDFGITNPGAAEVKRGWRYGYADNDSAAALLRGL